MCMLRIFKISAFIVVCCSSLTVTQADVTKNIVNINAVLPSIQTASRTDHPYQQLSQLTSNNKTRNLRVTIILEADNLDAATI